MPAFITRFWRRNSGLALRRAGALLAALFCVALVSACGNQAKWHGDNVKGAFKPLAFTMTRAADGQEVTAADYKGKVVLLYFGYTLCPDVCPQTLSNLARVLKGLGDKASDVRVLFVTVDPNRDTRDIVAKYVKAFAPQIVGLRGTPDQLASLARRYRASYSVKPAPDAKDYVVTHSSAVYVFDRTGAARLIITKLSTAHPDIKGTEADLKRLID
jgi:protein SCO1/2